MRFPTAELNDNEFIKKSVPSHEFILRKRVNQAHSWGSVKVYTPWLREMLAELKELREMADVSSKRRVSLP